MPEKKEGYTRRAHSVCRLTCHAVFVVKYRRKYIREKLWKDSFWSNSYFLSTTGGADIETLERYIQRQGMKKSGDSKGKKEMQR